MARASTYTALSLDRYAQIMGINPVHFAGAVSNVFFPMRNRCSDIWLQESWFFSDSVSREEVALAITQSENDIADYLGWFVAPKWISQEVHKYPRHYRRDAYRIAGRNVRGAGISLKADWGKIIAGGQRATTLIKSAVAVTYSDDDGDGFAETATVTAVTTETDVFELFVFTADKNAAPEWEIRPPREKSISGGMVTFKFWSWQMIDPDLWGEFPTTSNLDSGPTAIDLRGLEDTPPVSTAVVSTVDVYRVYNDTTETSAQLLWEQSNKVDLGTFCSVTTGSCEACGFDTQDGCMGIRDAEVGIVIPSAATYNETSATWTHDNFTQCRNPDDVKLWYYCGQISNQYLSGQSYDPLEANWAKAIAYMATARLERPVCSCGNLRALYEKMQYDMARVGNEVAFSIAPSDLNNPFGTRYGEVYAWRQAKRERKRIIGGGAV